MSRKAAERKEMPFHLSLCPLDISLIKTPIGKASSKVGCVFFFRFLRFHVAKWSRLRGRRCTVVRAIAPRCSSPVKRYSILRDATHYYHAVEKSQKQTKRLLGGRFPAVVKRTREAFRLRRCDFSGITPRLKRKICCIPLERNNTTDKNPRVGRFSKGAVRLRWSHTACQRQSLCAPLQRNAFRAPVCGGHG